jgi:hypothetical protein
MLRGIFDKETRRKAVAVVGRCYGAWVEIRLLKSSEGAADASRWRVFRKVITDRRASFAISKGMEIIDRGAILSVRRRSAKTWRGTALSRRGGGEIKKSRAVCIGRPAVER